MPMIQLDDPRFAEMLEDFERYATVLAAVLAMTLVWAFWKQLRHWWIKWRWHHKLARNPFPSREDRHDYEWALSKLDPAEGEEVKVHPSVWFLRLAIAMVGLFGTALLLAFTAGLRWPDALLLTSTGTAAISWLWAYYRKEPDRNTPLAGMRPEPVDTFVPPQPFELVVFVAVAMFFLWLIVVTL